LEPLIPKIYEALGQELLVELDWLVIDSSSLTVEQTVDAILQGLQ
jgi:hypothetical protein